MDKQFKFIYNVYAFSLLPQLVDSESEWQDQVLYMTELWEKVQPLINKEQFKNMFKRSCEELNLPHGTYDMDEAFHKANGEWAEELMLATADQILKWYDDNIPLKAEGVVKFKNGRIVVNTNICADPVFLAEELLLFHM